jgi:hypothetical protein
LLADHCSTFHKLKEELHSTTEIQKLVDEVKKDPSSHPHFQIFEELLFFKGRLYIPPMSSFKQVLLDEFHSSPLGGHSGIAKTYGRLKENVFWPNMK